MRFVIVASLTALALGGCGPSGVGHGTTGGAPNNGACALIPNANTLFGAGERSFGYAGLDAMAATCEFISADGKRGGDIITYTSESLHGVTPAAAMQTVTSAWDGQTETPLSAIDGLGEAAQIARDLPGYQTQIAFRKGPMLVLIAARSGDEAITGEQLARNMAAAAANNIALAR
jgi:hypothetical protein